MLPVLAFFLELLGLFSVGYFLAIIIEHVFKIDLSPDHRKLIFLNSEYDD